jgi:hypothetical protein
LCSPDNHPNRECFVSLPVLTRSHANQAPSHGVQRDTLSSAELLQRDMGYS